MLRQSGWHVKAAAWQERGRLGGRWFVTDQYAHTHLSIVARTLGASAPHFPLIHTLHHSRISLVKNPVKVASALGLGPQPLSLGTLAR